MTDTEPQQEKQSDDEFDPDELKEMSQENKDRFIRGVMISQVFAKVTKEDPADVAEVSRTEPGIAGEYAKLMDGKENDYEQAILDHYGIPYSFAKDSIKLRQPYAQRYRKAWVELGVEASAAQKVLNIVTLGTLGGAYDE